MLRLGTSLVSLPSHILKGSLTSNFVPLFGVEVHETVPPICSVNVRIKNRPRPVPPYCRENPMCICFRKQNEYIQGFACK